MSLPLVRPICCDTETWYKEGSCSVRSHKNGWLGGNYHYTHHPEFYCYMITWCDPETGESGVLDDPSEFPGFINSVRGRTIIAHNAGFDIAVFKRIVPDFEPLNTFDTADMSSYLQVARSLDTASEFLLDRLVDKGVRAFMNGKHYRDLTPQQKQDMRNYALCDARTTADLFVRYCNQWPAIEQWMSDFTRKQNWAGVHIDENYLHEQIDKVSAIRSAAARKIPWVEDLEVDKPLSAKKLAVYCREVGIEPPESLAEDSEECQAWEQKYGDAYPVVGAIRDFRKSNTYYRKLDLIVRLLRPDGTIPLSTKYAAAPHTLRFSATQFNYQSLPRSTDYCDLRGCLVPPPGHVFVGSDLAGIEARCLPWLAGDFAYLDEVAKLDRQAEAEGVTGGGDIYEPAARRMFNYTDKRPLKKVDKDLRNATKVCVLQLGYQSGAAKFLWYIGNNVSKEVLDRVRQGDETDEALALRLVKLYRGMNPKVQDLWYGLDGELRAAQVAGANFSVQQPNGRVVNYYDLMVAGVTDSTGRFRQEISGLVCRGGERAKLYGGKITENICQEMARHVLVHGIYNLSQAGFNVRMSIHDENVIEVPEAMATRDTTRQIEQIMATAPPWAPRLPLAAETSIMKRYAK